MEPEFKFFLTRDQSEIEIEAGNVSDLNFERKRPVETCMSLRKVLTGNIIVTDKALSGELSPYQWLVSIKNSNERASEIKLRVEQIKSGMYATVYNGYFTTASCKFDESRRTVEISQEPDDEYRGILEGYNSEINLLDAPTPSVDPVIDILTFRFDDPSSSNHESWFDFTTSATTTTQPNNSLVLGPIDSEESDYSGLSIYIREEVQIEPGQFDTINDELSGWTKRANNSLEYQRVPLIEIFLEDLKVIRSANIGNYSGYEVVFTWTDGDIGGGTEFNLIWNLHQHKSAGTLPNTRKLTDTLKYLLSQIDSSIEPLSASSISDFFSLSNNYIGDVSNLYKDVRICQITDVKSPTATTSATTGLIKLKELLEDLNSLGFYWFINSSGKFQIEHLYYFDSLTNSNDLTISSYSDYVEWMNSYEYLKEEIPSKEIWTVTSGSRHEESGNFKSIEMEYNSIDRRNENDGEETTNEIRTICFDLRDIWRNPSRYSNNLNCLVAVDSQGKIYRAEDSGSRYYNLNYPFDLDKLCGINLNGNDTGVSIIPLLQYGRYGTSAKLQKYSGSSDGDYISVTNQSLIRRKKQVELTIPNFKTIEFDFLGKWLTEVSQDGKIESAIESLVNGTISLQINHPEENETASPVYHGVPVYPTDDSGDNVCTGNIVLVAEKTSQGYVIVTSQGYGIKITS